MAEPSRKRKRVSKNKKKNWRKHTDITEIEDYLEDKRLQERTGGLVADKPDEKLFFVDKDVVIDTDEPAKKKKRGDKQLKCHALLEPDPKIPPVTVKHNVRKEDRKKFANIKAQKEAKAAVSVSRLRAIEQRQGANKARKERIREKRKPQIASYDLWGKEDENRNVQETGNEHYLRVTRKKNIRVPNNYRKLPSELPAVEVPHPGASYNPTYEDHQDLLNVAYVAEADKQKREKKITRALDEQFPKKRDAPTEASWITEMSAGLFDKPQSDNEDYSSDNEEEDEGETYLNVPVRREDKKTNQQRRKDQERKLKEKLKAKEKEEKQKKSKIYRLKTLKAEVNSRLEELNQRAAKKAEKAEATKNDPKKLGKLKFEATDLEVKLSDELVGSLRLLKPEGNLAEERFNSLQKRNVIEPRKRAKLVRRYKLKEFEKKSHQAVKL